MASTLEFVNYVCEQVKEAGVMEYKRMFGEYGIYCNQKLIGLICENQFYLKISEKGRKLLKEEVFAEPYPGAKPIFLIESLDDKDYITELIQVTYEELPEPKPKKRKRK